MTIPETFKFDEPKYCRSTAMRKEQNAHNFCLMLCMVQNSLRRLVMQKMIHSKNVRHQS